MLNFTSIKNYHDQLSTGHFSCLEVTRQYLAAIEQNSHLNAFLEVFEEEALARAAALDKQTTKGKLHGVVIGIKDNLCYCGHKVSAASKMLEGFTSLYSATAVERLIQEGAIIIGRQNCDEFGMGSTNENSAFGPVLNPHNNDLVAGGSSGGSAAAVSAGLCMASLGSDTGGSVRLPADYCGVVGLKPTYGRVSRYGLIAYASSFDQIGILTRNVEDAERILEVISGPDDFDSTAITTTLQPHIEKPKGKYRFAYFPEWIDHTSVDPEIAGQLKSFIKELQQNGYSAEPVNFPLTDYIVPAYYILTTAEASSNLSRYDGVRYGKRSSHNEDLANFYKANRTEGFGAEVKRRIMLGSFVLSAGYHDAFYTRAQQVRQLLLEQTRLIFNEFDFILAPNSPKTAPPLAQQEQDPLEMYMGDIFTVFANLTGVPAISLPVFKHSSNLPFGLQLLAAEQNEVPLLRISHQLMQQ